jgi:hypothetical protein
MIGWSVAKAFMVKRDTPFFQEGDIVYERLGHDYGLASMDAFYTQQAHQTVTYNADGSPPGATIPTSALEEITGFE